ncbi:MAG: Acyl-CoA:lysophosphatidylglycerol acyltransferase 1 [Pycnora praestabilis]|nr:MAG: Acyl-CoA:lysophosphatidylglycerol acyltransferase 1 [Pycnora praestabilis]
MVFEQQIKQRPAGAPPKPIPDLRPNTIKRANEDTTREAQLHTQSTGTQNVPAPFVDLDVTKGGKAEESHPAGRVKHGGFNQILRVLVFVDWFMTVCFSAHFTQILGSPLYFINRDYYYAYMSLTKQTFGLLITTITQWFSPTVIRVSGHRSVRGQLGQTKDGRLEVDFPERLVMIANHQIYTEWLYLWWISYTNRMKMHGHIYIILKESLKYVPIIGPGMMFFGFVFMARNWAKDKLRLQHRLQQLKGSHSGPMSGTQTLDPMWLMIFPEGTNLSANTRKRSVKWANKQGIPDFQHQLLPRSTGLQYCLQELKGTVDWVYDCTIAYEGIPRGGYAQDYFTLRSTYFQGRPPKSVNMYWRRLAVSSMPLDDSKAFELWIRERWSEKEALLEHFLQNGRFPADEGRDAEGSADGKVMQGAGYIETEVRLDHWWEIGRMFVVLLTFALVANVSAKFWNLVFYGNFVGSG